MVFSSNIHQPAGLMAEDRCLEKQRVCSSLLSSLLLSNLELSDTKVCEL